MSLDQRWSMWFNAIIRAKPYQSLQYFLIYKEICKHKFYTGVAWLSSARVVRLMVNSEIYERNPFFLLDKMLEIRWFFVILKIF